MSKVFYSAANGGFYEEHVHGFRQVDVADPAWVRPVLTVTLAPGETFGAMTNAGKKPLVIKDAPDMDAVAPEIRVDNPDCKIPADAVEVTDAYRWELVNAQVTGKVIVANAEGFPVLQDPPPPSVSELAARVRRERDARMADFEWRYARNAREARLGLAASDAIKALDGYMQALAAITEQEGFPTDVVWPVFGD